MSRRVGAAVLGSVALSTVGLVLVGFWYVPLSVDGGWYSYPAYSLSLGRDPYSHLLPYADVAGLDGLKVLFRFETTSFFRILYTAPWFKLVGAGIFSIQVLGLLEFAALVAIAYRLYSEFFSSHTLALLATAFLITDKAIVIRAAADFRPDVSLAAASCLFYIMFRREATSAAHTLATAAIAAVVSTIHTTAIIPLSFVFAAAATEAWLGDPQKRLAKLRRVVVAGTVALIAFFGRVSAFHFMLGSRASPDDPVSPVGRILEMWGEGPLGVAAKELERWSGYFVGSNIALLVTVFVAVALLAWQITRGRGLPNDLRGPLVGLAVAVVVTLGLDPHVTFNHLIPLTPFLLLSLSAFEAVPEKSRNRVLATLLLISCALSAWVGLRLMGRYASEEVGNRWLRETFASLTRADRRYTVAGATELWPYLPLNRDIVLVDLTRDPDELGLYSRLELGEFDYLLVNVDYTAHGWDQWVREEAANDNVRILVDKPSYLIVAEVTKE